MDEIYIVSMFMNNNKTASKGKIKNASKNKSRRL